MGDPVLLPTILAPFRIGPDWLTLSMSGPPRLLDYTEPMPWIGNYWWTDSGKRTRVMGKMFYLTAPDGEKVLTVAGCPSSTAIGPPDWMLVQFENRTLHNGEFERIYHTLREMGFRYKAIARMDLAADAIAGMGGDYMEPMQRVWNGDAEYYGRAKWQPRMTGRKRVEGAVLGSRSSNKFFRVYDKTKELKTAHAAHKAEYIRAAWEMSLGYDPVMEGQTVNRLEMQVKGREIRRYFPEEVPTTQQQADRFIHSLGQSATCADMFASMAARTYDFRTPAKRSRDAKGLIEWDFGSVSQGLDLRPREKRLLAFTDQAFKGMIKNMWRSAWIKDDHLWIAKAIEEAERMGLRRWVDKRVPVWRKELQHIKDHGDTTLIDRMSGDL